MQAVSREDIGVAVDVVQRYLHARQRADAGKLATKRQHECEVERRAAIALVDGRVDLEVRPRREGGGARSLQRSQNDYRSCKYSKEAISLHPARLRFCPTLLMLRTQI